MKRTLALFAAVLALWTEGALGCQVGPMKPLELLFAPFFKGPSFIRTNSHGAQFAGRTTISSGSASQVVSTSNVASDSLIGLAAQVALPAGYTFVGRTAIASGLATAPASTTAIYSGDIVLATFESPNALTSGMALRVDSIVNGISFSLATTNGLTTIASGAVAMWEISAKDPSRLKVNTISDGSYFTIGWADGRARPVDVVVMWETKRPGSA